MQLVDDCRRSLESIGNIYNQMQQVELIADRERAKIYSNLGKSLNNTWGEIRKKSSDSREASLQAYLQSLNAPGDWRGRTGL